MSPGWIRESGPAAAKNATSMAITTAAASRFCARLGGKLERTKGSGTTVAVLNIGANSCNRGKGATYAHVICPSASPACRLFPRAAISETG
jgi:hypothetical protein